jgi:hypothetical protein
VVTLNGKTRADTELVSETRARLCHVNTTWVVAKIGIPAGVDDESAEHPHFDCVHMICLYLYFPIWYHQLAKFGHSKSCVQSRNAYFLLPLVNYYQYQVVQVMPVPIHGFDCIDVPDVRNFPSQW